MNPNEITAIVEQINEWTEIMEDAKAMVESLKDSLKADMDRKGLEEMEAGTHIIRWTSVLSNRFDSTAFKKFMPDVYKAYTKQVASRRFTIT